MRVGIRPTYIYLTGSLVIHKSKSAKSQRISFTFTKQIKGLCMYNRQNKNHTSSRDYLYSPKEVHRAEEFAVLSNSLSLISLHPTEQP